MEQHSNTQILFSGDASAFIFDIRNSTKMTIEAAQKNKLNLHVDVMLSVNQKILSSLHKLAKTDQFAFNDTGDGCLCIFWDRNHALTCLKIATSIYQYLTFALQEKADRYTETIGAPPLSFGMGLHTASCSIGRITYTAKSGGELFRNYIYGTVANSAARLESFSKNYIHEDFLMSADFKDLVLKQYDDQRLAHEADLTQHLSGATCLGEIDLKDYREGGHWVYSLEEVAIEEILSIFGLHRHQKHCGSEK